MTIPSIHIENFRATLTSRCPWEKCLLSCLGFLNESEPTNGSEEVILALISKFWEDKQGFLLNPSEPGSFKRNSTPGT